MGGHGLPQLTRVYPLLAHRYMDQINSQSNVNALLRRGDRWEASVVQHSPRNMHARIPAPPRSLRVVGGCNSWLEVRVGAASVDADCADRTGPCPSFLDEISNATRVRDAPVGRQSWTVEPIADEVDVLEIQE